jgi:transposase
MEVLYPRCAGLDVHKETVVAYVRVMAGGPVQATVRTFTTTTAGLLELADWLTAHGCTHVAMESTGVQCAWAATRAKDTYLQAQSRRLKSQRGPMKAVVAVAASILTAAYHMFRDGVPYRELGPHHFARVDKARLAQRLARRLRDRGYEVQLNARAA